MKLDQIRWDEVHASIHENGFSIISKVLNKEECEHIIKLYSEETHFRKKIVMERYRFGLGEYKYLQYPLPESIARLRKYLYSHLHDIANNWNKKLNSELAYPSSHEDFIELCKL